MFTSIHRVPLGRTTNASPDNRPHFFAGAFSRARKIAVFLKLTGNVEDFGSGFCRIQPACFGQPQN
ncbi:hypothetical protein HNQ96_000256 [Aminobacter lissarensis]|uniref:Uncharacterized protein n=1 Tax=Aminobacter carboxidus TaxID=376165 RepID=A0A8E2BAU4_9HYPH|nr:hypothetical protein [Aminobacter lissarensis]MBB6464409.1 hypothetical protein [Aminobacter lissarensis]